MAAYVVFVRDRITDPEEFKTYGQKAPLAREGHDMKALAFYGTIKTLEGPSVDGSVIIEFRRWRQHRTGTIARFIKTPFSIVCGARSIAFL